MADSDSDTSSAGLSDGLGTSRDTRTGRLLHRFYEPLILLRVLDPTRGKQNYHSPADQGSDNSHHFWGKFLDHLSWMCDYKQGGATVSAIAAEKTNDGPTFWLAAPKNSRSKVQPHLEWILNQLDNLPAKNQERVEQEILTCCIEFSRSKVKNYSRSLCTRIRRCTEILAVSVQESGTSDAFYLYAHLIRSFSWIKQSLRHRATQRSGKTRISTRQPLRSVFDGIPISPY